jgi:hypothetical protein
MKLVNRKTFIELPDGTIYSKYFDGWNFHEISIKCETRFGMENEPIDWLSMPLNEIHYGTKSEDTQKRFDEMIEKGEEEPITLNCTTRDGLFEDEQIFAVYDKNDINKMIEMLVEINGGWAKQNGA